MNERVGLVDARLEESVTVTLTVYVPEVTGVQERLSVVDEAQPSPVLGATFHA